MNQELIISKNMDWTWIGNPEISNFDHRTDSCRLFSRKIFLSGSTSNCFQSETTHCEYVLTKELFALVCLVLRNMFFKKGMM